MGPIGSRALGGTGCKVHRSCWGTVPREIREPGERVADDHNGDEDRRADDERTPMNFEVVLLELSAAVRDLQERFEAHARTCPSVQSDE